MDARKKILVESVSILEYSLINLHLGIFLGCIIDIWQVNNRNCERVDAMEIREEGTGLHMQTTNQESSPPQQTVPSEDGNYIATEERVDTTIENIIEPASQITESCQPNSMLEANIRPSGEEQGCRTASGILKIISKNLVNHVVTDITVKWFYKYVLKYDTLWPGDFFL